MHPASEEMQLVGLLLVSFDVNTGAVIACQNQVELLHCVMSVQQLRLCCVALLYCKHVIGHLDKFEH